MSLATFPAPKSTFLQLLPPQNPKMCDALFPHPYALDPFLFRGINKSPNVVACCLPWGVPLHWPIFNFCPPGFTLTRKKKSYHDICLASSVPEMGYGVESWWVYFVWYRSIAFHGIGMPFHGDPKSGITIFTQLIYTRGRILE